MDEHIIERVRGQRLHAGAIGLFAVIGLCGGRYHVALADSALEKTIAKFIVNGCMLLGVLGALIYSSGYSVLMLYLDRQRSALGHANPAKNYWLMPTLRLGLVNPAFFFGLVAGYVEKYVFPQYNIPEGPLMAMGMGWCFVAFTSAFVQLYLYHRANEKHS